MIKKEKISTSAGNFFLELYKRYSPSSGATRYEYALKDADQDEGLPGQVGTFEFLVPDDNSDYAIADDVYLEPPYRNQNLYRTILSHAKDFFKSIGLKGVMSKGRSRSSDATKSWEKIKTRKEESPEIYNGHKFVDMYLENNNSSKRIMTFNQFKNNI
mgnify:FL=1